MHEHMSKLDVLDDLLLRYQQLKYHQNHSIEQRLNAVQQWQKKRLLRTHHSLFSQKENKLMAQYFVNRLYGSPDFDQLAVQISRLIKHAHKIEALIPAQAIQTGTHGIALAILAVELDEQLAQELLRHFPAKLEISDQMIQHAYTHLDQHNLRSKQLAMTDQLGVYLDQYLRSRMLHSAFKLAKPLAYRNQFQSVYDFIQEGFQALKPMTSAQQFIQQFTAQERHVLQHI